MPNTIKMSKAQIEALGKIRETAHASHLRIEDTNLGPAIAVIHGNGPTGMRHWIVAESGEAHELKAARR